MLTIPFLDKLETAVFLSDQRLEWVEFGLRRRLRIRRLQSESIENEEPSAVLSRLIGRLKPPFIISHLEPDHVRHFIAETNSGADDELAAWAAIQVAKALPWGADLNAFVIRHAVIQTADGRQRCLIAYARRSVIDERVALLREAGLVPLSVGSIFAVLGHAFSFEPSFVEGRSAILFACESSATLLLYEDGALSAIHTLDSHSPKAALAEALECVRLLEAAGPGDRVSPLVLVSEGEDWPTHADSDRGIMDARKLLSHLRGTHSTGTPAAPATALAMAGLFPTLPSINFLDPETAARNRQECEKRQALRFMLRCGMGAFLLLVLLVFGNAYLSVRIERADTLLLEAAPHLERIKQAHATLESHRAGRVEARQLLQARSNAAGILEVIARSVPENAWLERVKLSHGEETGSSILLSGMALNVSDAASLLSRLESERHFKEVRLLHSETHSSTARRSQVLLPAINAHRFEIQLSTSPQERPVEAEVD